MALTTPTYHIDLQWLAETYGRMRKDGAVGVDGQTAAPFAAHLRHKTRPIGIPDFEDKVLQRAVGMVLEAVYEQDFFRKQTSG